MVEEEVCLGLRSGGSWPAGASVRRAPVKRDSPRLSAFLCCV